MRHLTMLFGSCVVVSSLFAVNEASAELVSNGGFESGDFSGWTQTPNPLDFSVVVAGTVPPPHSGTYDAWLGSPDTLESLSQMLATDSAAQYELHYWLRHNPFESGANQFQVSWGGTMLSGVSNCSGTDLGTFPYTECVFSHLSPTGSSTELKFSFQHETDYFQLDDVSVQVVPLPASMPLLLSAGLIMSVLAYKRRREMNMPQSALTASMLSV